MSVHAGVAARGPLSATPLGIMSTTKPSVCLSFFLSPNRRDKPFVRRVASTLRAHGVRVWLDEAELNVGDSLFTKIGAAILDMNYFIVVLSEYSVESRWVQEELSVAMARQFDSSGISKRN